MGVLDFMGGDKTDFTAKEFFEELVPKVLEAFSAETGIRPIPVSALTRAGFPELLDQLGRTTGPHRTSW